MYGVEPSFQDARRLPLRDAVASAALADAVPASHKNCKPARSTASVAASMPPATSLAHARVAAANEVTIVIQIDGKVRDRVTAPAGISQSAAEKLAMASPKVRAALDGREPDRTIFVPDRLVNFVVTRRPS